MFVFNLFRYPSLSRFLRALTFISVTYFVLFILPQAATWRPVWYWFSVATAILTVVSVPTLFVDSIGIGPFQIRAWHTTTSLPIVDFNTFSGIFINPNTLGQTSAIAALSSLQFIREGDRRSMGLFGVNASAVALSGSRVGAAILVICTGLFVVHELSGRRWLAIMTVTGMMSALVGVLMFFNVLPVDLPIDLTGRKELWTATIRAVIDSPLGYGPGILGEVLSRYVEAGGAKNPHNAYLKVLLSGGILAGFAHVCIYLISIRRAIWSVTQTDGVSVYILLTATMIIGLFNGSSIFGLSAVSAMSALILGYALQMRITPPSSTSFDSQIGDRSRS